MKTEELKLKLNEIFKNATTDWNFIRNTILGLIQNYDENQETIETEISKRDHEDYLSYPMEGLAMLKNVLKEMGLEVEGVSVGGSIKNPEAKGVFATINLKKTPIPNLISFSEDDGTGYGEEQKA